MPTCSTRTVIRACNPALGIFLDAETLFKEAEQARRLPSAKARSAICAAISGSRRRRICCARRACGSRATRRSTPAIFRDGRPVYGGLDLSARLDLTAMVLAAEDDAGAFI